MIEITALGDGNGENKGFKTQALRTSDWAFCLAFGLFSNLWDFVIVAAGKMFRPFLMPKKEEEDGEQIRVHVTDYPVPAAAPSAEKDTKDAIIDAIIDVDVNTKGTSDEALHPAANFLNGKDDICVAKLWQEHFDGPPRPPSPGSRSRSPSPPGGKGNLKSVLGSAGTPVAPAPQQTPAPQYQAPVKWKPTALKTLKSQNSIPHWDSSSGRSQASAASKRSNPGRAVSKRLQRAFSKQECVV